MKRTYQEGTRIVKKALYICRDCEEDFIAARKTKKYIFCPLCGENDYTEKIRKIVIPQPIIFHRNWTKEEDELVESGKFLGKTDEQIAAELDGRTSLSIKSRRARLKAIEKKRLAAEVKGESR